MLVQPVVVVVSAVFLGAAFFIALWLFFLACLFALCALGFALVTVVLAVVVLPLVDTVVVALVLPDLVVTVLLDGACAAIAGVAIRAATATDAINFFILFLLSSGKICRRKQALGAVNSHHRGGHVKWSSS